MAAYDAVRDFDIVHDHTVMGPVYAERFPDLPVVTTIHGPFNDELTDLYSPHRRPRADHRHLPRPAEARARHPHRPGHPPRPRRRGLPGRRGRRRVLPVPRAHVARQGRRTAPSRRPRRRACRCSWRPRCARPWEFEYFEMIVKPHLTDDIQYLGEVPHEHKLAAARRRQGVAVPDPLERAVRHGDDRGAGVRHPGARVPRGRRPRGRRRRPHRLPLPRRDRHGRGHRPRRRPRSRADCRAAVAGYFSTHRMVAEHLALFEDVVAGRHHNSRSERSGRGRRRLRWRPWPGGRRGRRVGGRRAGGRRGGRRR